MIIQIAGGGISTFFRNTLGLLVIYNCFFESNESDLGGAVRLDIKGIVVAENNTFIQNKAFFTNLIASCSAILLAGSIQTSILRKNLYFLNFAENKGKICYSN